jgi:hypothetical protein
VVWFTPLVAFAMTKWFWPKRREQKEDRPPVPTEGTVGTGLQTKEQAA